jgi:ABC-2 type transport system ATP-binding protein
LITKRRASPPAAAVVQIAQCRKFVIRKNKKEAETASFFQKILVYDARQYGMIKKRNAKGKCLTVLFCHAIMNEIKPKGTKSTMLKIEHLTKQYGEKKAVDDLSLHIEKGEIYGFIGHNGAGKTTTIKACCGILNFDAGEIYVDGISIKDAPLEAKKRIAYIPDNPDLYDFMTGMQFLNFVCDIFAIPQEAREKDIKRYADAFALTDDLGMSISAYSHGMKQKLAIIAAFVHHPKLIVLDEPFVGLDPKASHLLKEMMRKACDEGAAIFFSTHVLEVAEKLCDKIAIIQNGCLVKSGATEEVKGDSSLENVFLELEEEKA